MKKEAVTKNVGKIVLSLVEKYAFMKANSLCRGRTFEPSVPNKLRREGSYHEKNK